jgi:predicted ATP-grasp superfamily ATP-dependent carboligase
MTPATEARLYQLQNVWRVIRQMTALQFRELDRDAQEALLAATGELERALKSHDPYAVAVALDAVEDLFDRQEGTYMINHGASRRDRLLQKARNQLRAFKETVRELAASSNQAKLAQLIKELQDQMRNV